MYGCSVLNTICLYNMLQYGFVFGIVSLAAFLFAPIFGRYGTAIGPKLLYNTGGFVQGLSGIAFGLLDYVQDTVAFIGLSYFLRYLGWTWNLTVIFECHSTSKD